VVDGNEQVIGREAAEAIRQALVQQKMLDEEGRILSGFDSRRLDFRLMLPAEHSDLSAAVVDLLTSYQIERHIRKEKDEGPNRLRKDLALTPEFQALWDRIKPRTTYRVEFETDTLVYRATAAIRRMAKIEPPGIKVITGQIGVTRAGVSGTMVGASADRVAYGTRPLPDLLAYLRTRPI
jgi:type III restriction enzyme